MTNLLLKPIFELKCFELKVIFDQSSSCVFIKFILLGLSELGSHSGQDVWMVRTYVIQ